MGFLNALQGHFSSLQHVEMLLRVLLAAICGGLVGIERSRRFKDAGVRTHALVAASAAALMIVSKYAFADLSGVENTMGVKSADPARIAAQVVTGVGFLGAGVIYRDRKFITRGLTTAAGIWSVSGVGLAIGAGLYYIGMFLAVTVCLIQIASHHILSKRDMAWTVNIDFSLKNRSGAISSLHEFMDEHEIKVLSEDLDRTSDEVIHCAMIVRAPNQHRLQDAIDVLIGDEGIVSINIRQRDR